MSETGGKTRREHLQDALEHARAMRDEWRSKLKIFPTDTYTKQKFHRYDKRVRWYEREIKRGKMMDWIPGTPRPSTNPRRVLPRWAHHTERIETR